MTTDQRPEPPIASDVTLRDFDYMPLQGERLFRSDTWLMASPEGRCAALQLWWASWHQEPAGSLPDNDRLLANLAGYGVAVSAFVKIKAEAMRGWFQASDGRLYHLVVCELALDAWKAKRRKESENAADRERKRRKKGASTAEIPPEPAAPSGGNPDGSGGAPAGNDGLSGKNPPENALKGKRREEEGKKEATQLGPELPSAPEDAQSEVRRSSDLARAFDAAVVAVWGEAQRRPWPAGTDSGTALRWLRAGVTPELVAAVAEPRFRRMAAQGKARPGTLAFLDAAVTETLADAARQGLPPPGTKPDPEREAAAKRYTAAVDRWHDDGRQGPAPRPEDFGLGAAAA